ncbi:hypothetical protein GW17_00039769 [Ensete ventricosum]|uniref:Uncharacterized protein n=1 Tax=Ensete ventricosum TaxID=4639 RepID=A0A444DH42_ENSVE|nr:hypothetical protein B296_00054439 [Ensete ventricosum]RWV97441.1 hypothetical protein GW17_00039769 [Ensete ventricosum]
MDIVSYSVSKEHDEIYQKWFSFADSGSSSIVTLSSLLIVLKKMHRYFCCFVVADLEKVNPPVMEGLDTFLSTNKPPTKEIDPDQDGIELPSGPDERTIPGNTIAVEADMPFTGLTKFGNAFLSKFQCSQMPHSV